MLVVGIPEAAKRLLRLPRITVARFSSASRTATGLPVYG
jgi:hypothetical protein